MNESTTVRVNRQTYNEIKDLADKQNKNMQNIIDLAIKQYKKIQYFQELNLSFLRLKENKELWDEEKNERKMWDSTLADGLD
jgi:predicted transcriptional regulator